MGFYGIQCLIKEKLAIITRILALFRGLDPTLRNPNRLAYWKTGKLAYKEERFIKGFTMRKTLLTATSLFALTLIACNEPSSKIPADTPKAEIMKIELPSVEMPTIETVSYTHLTLPTNREV